jgi:plastocyanin
MKTLKLDISKLSKMLLLAMFSCLVAVACSDNSTDPEPEPEPPIVSFNSGNISPGGTFSYTFADEGTVEYYCGLHAPDMQGVVNVAANAEISGQTTVRMNGMQFVPSQITVAPGTEITWVNEDAVDHTVTSGNPSSGGGNGDGY